jgi:hypothetical protein
MPKFMKFNANDLVKVTLTGEGMRILANYWGGQIPVWYSTCIDEEGMWEFQFHTLAHIFGEHLYNGNSNLPFKTWMLIGIEE